MAMRTCDQCEKKVYADESAATTAAVRNAGKYGDTYSVYRCPKGRGWHLTTKSETRPVMPTFRPTPPPKPVESGGLLVAPPLVQARRLAEADLKGRASASDLAWLHANPLMWARALLTIARDIENHVAKDRTSLAGLKPKPGEPVSVEYAEAKAAVETRSTRRLHFEAVVRRRMEEVKSLLGPQPAYGWMSTGDVLGVLLDITVLAEEGDLRAVVDKATFYAERWARQLHNESSPEGT